MDEFDKPQSETTQQTEVNIVYVWKIPIDRDFVKSVVSFLKVGAAFLSLIAFCCVAAGRTEDCDDDYSSTYNYFEFVAISTFLTMLLNWVLFALAVFTRTFLRVVPWKLGDLIILGVFSLLYLIANICVAAQDCGKDSNKAGAAFGFFTLFCMLGNAAITGRDWWMTRQADASQSRNSQEYNAERNMEQY